MTAQDKVIVADGLRKVFHERGRNHVAVEGATFRMTRGRNLGIVGESGSGKSTLARMLMGIERPTAGTVEVCGVNMTAPARSRAERKRRAKLTQMVYQDPFGSLDPRQTVESTLREVLMIHAPGDKSTHSRRIEELCELVGLTQAQRRRSPRDLSGGQRQRVAIARSLAVEPRLIVLDEAVSALDISIQAQILNLLMDVQEATGTDYVLISHDLAVVAHLTQDVIVMRNGQILESGETKQVLARPQEEYTRVLRDSVPSPGWRRPGVLEAIASRLTQ